MCGLLGCEPAVVESNPSPTGLKHQRQADENGRGEVCQRNSVLFGRGGDSRAVTIFKAGSSLNSKKTLDKCEVSPLGPSRGCVRAVAQTLVLYTWCEIVL